MANCYHCKHLYECKDTKEEKKDCKRFVWHVTCDFCGRSLSPSDVEDYGTLCESCYQKEYND